MSKKKNNNIFKEEFEVTKKLRSQRLNQVPKVFWFTGLSGSGKSTISNAFEKTLFKNNFLAYTLDGDNTRFGLCSDLDFTEEDRNENIRRVGEVSKILLDAGLIVCASFISPFKKDREKVKSIVGPENFIEIYVRTPLNECIQRDPKGLYSKALSGEISDFTGISSPYEEPNMPDLVLDTLKLPLEESIRLLYNLYREYDEKL